MSLDTYKDKSCEFNKEWLSDQGTDYIQVHHTRGLWVGDRWAISFIKSAKVAKWKSHPAYTTVTSVLGWLWVWAFLPNAFIPFSLFLWRTLMYVGSSTSNPGNKRTHFSSFKGICFHLLLHVHCLCVLIPLFEGHLKTSSTFSSQGESWQTCRRW